MSLRALMLLIVVVAGWLGWICHRARVQREAVAAIERAGGQVWFNWQLKNGVVTGGEPGWLRRRLGPGFFEEVKDVQGFSKVGDALMPHVGHLHHLDSLAIAGCDVTDEGVKQLAQLSELWFLNLGKTRITDAGLVIGRLTNLEILILDNTAVTDAGLVHLAGLKRCQIYVSGTRVTQEGVAALKSMCPWMWIYPFGNWRMSQVKESSVGK
jgi:hypothetical protein